MRISDWSSDVCSSDLDGRKKHDRARKTMRLLQGMVAGRYRILLPQQPDERRPRLQLQSMLLRVIHLPVTQRAHSYGAHVLPMGTPKIGRASCRERVCKYV